MATHSQYLHKALDSIERKEAITKARKKLRGFQYDAIVVTGVSGLTFGSILSHLSDKPLIVVRKDKDNTHSAIKVEGERDFTSWLFVDDCISAGNTLRRVQGIIRGINPYAKQVGSYLYRPGVLRKHDGAAWCGDWAKE